jgi:hypothetical protein
MLSITVSLSLVMLLESKGGLMDSVLHSEKGTNFLFDVT